MCVYDPVCMCVLACEHALLHWHCVYAQSCVCVLFIGIVCVHDPMCVHVHMRA